MVTTIDISVVVVTYQSRSHIASCLQSIAASAAALKGAVEVVIVDNGSTDGTIDVARQVMPDALILSGHGNIGFARGCNLGAARSSGRHILFLNPDATLRPPALRALLLTAAEHPEAGLLGGRTLRADGRVEHTCAAGQMTLWSLLCFASGLSSIFPRSRVFDPESLGTWERDTAREVPMLSGAVLMATREAWQTLGGFDERYFMYAEDADLCARARSEGLRPRLVPGAEAVHLVGGSSASGNKQVLLHRGKATFVRCRWRRGTRHLGVLLLMVGVWLRARLAGRAAGGNDVRRRAEPASWSTAWERRQEWTGGW